MTKEQTATEDAVWNDAEFLHAYRGIGGVWDGGPAACGYSGPGPLYLGNTIPPNACPICAALFKAWNE